ncbi:hypothetical protein K457DRAFT_57590, partial [Linnemannia elongata AG-77]
IDTAALIIESIWPSPVGVTCSAKTPVIPLHIFVKETLRRSRTTLSTLQLALYYIYKIRNQSEPVGCGRRMFLAALILASKFQQDRTYSNKAWSKISGLPVAEINLNEITFLTLIDYRLFVSQAVFQKW